MDITPEETVGGIYQDIRRAFRDVGLDTPELDARLLLGEAAGIEPAQIPLYMDRELNEEQRSLLLGWVEKRLSGMPVGRIVGHREFWGLDFRLNEATLEPRPDTEILVEAVLNRADADQACLFLDVGTGTGAIAISLLHELPQALCIAIDISARALEQATANAVSHDVGDRFLAVQGDYLSAIGAVASSGGVDWVISNPPYIASSVVAGLKREVRLHDPNQALDGGLDGLDAYRSLTERAAGILRPGGHMALEIGYDQADAVGRLLEQVGFEAIETIQDLAGLDRVLVAKQPLF